MGLERRAEAEDHRERCPEVVGDEGEELVLVRLEVVARRDVPHHPLEADQLTVEPAGHRADVEHAAHRPGVVPSQGDGEPDVAFIGSALGLEQHAQNG